VTTVMRPKPTYQNRLADGVFIIANPAAAGISEGLVKQVASEFSVISSHVEVAWTRAPGDAGRYAVDAATSAAAGVIVAVGGDGTLADVCAGLAHIPMNAAAVLALPAGSGNSSARNLWGDLTWEQVLQTAGTIDNCIVRRLDLLRLVEPGITILLGASTGFLAEVLISARNAEPALAGMDRYFAGAARVMQNMPAHPTRVTVDGHVLCDSPVSSVTVGGGRFRARQFQFLPDSVLDDGLIDVCTIPAVDGQGVRELLPLLMGGQHLSRPGVEYGRGRRIVIERTDGLPLVAEHDGDVWDGAGGTLTIDVVPDSIWAISPRQSPYG
jgi:diacylglycerol kinase (ATP)